MKPLKIFTLFSLFLILASCKTDSLEDYFVKATESDDFFVVNIPTNIVKFKTENLDAETQRQIASVKKINILLYKNDNDPAVKETEFKKAGKAISGNKYKTLAKIKDKGYQLLFSYLGDQSNIDEIIVLGKDQNNNFVIGKMKGDKIRVKNIAKALKQIESIDKEQAKSVIEMFNPQQD